MGVLGELGVLKDGADALSRLMVGAKYGMGESRALTADLRVVDEATEELGLRIGAMHTISSGELMINNAFQVGLLDGYTGGVGVALDLLIEPTKAFGDKLTGYIDIVVSTNTDDIGGDFLAINVGPNVDVMLNDMAVINAGVIVGVAGDRKTEKADDLGLAVTLLSNF